jgi:twitching motility protein PilT
MVGEMRDLETISLAITAAETGHLVLGTLHTGNAARTLDRVLDVFPIDQRDQIRIMVSESLRGIISQQLVPKADGDGRAMALEILVNNPAVSNCIREGKTFMLNGVMQTGKNVGMKLMDDSLRDLYTNRGSSARKNASPAPKTKS